MPNNIISNSPNAVVAKTDVTFAAAGITSANTSIILLADTVDKVYKSYIPGRGINAITGFAVNKGYIIQALADFDLSAYVVPPVGVQPTLATPANSLTVANSTQINSAWSAVPNATGYVLQRATNAGFTTGVVNLVNGSNVTSFDDTGLTASTTYYYRVKATAPSYNDSAYDTDSATTSAAPQLPSYILDRFIASDGTQIASRNTDSGESWTPGTGFATFHIVNNSAVPYDITGTDVTALSWLDASTADISAEINFTYGNGSSYPIGIVCRYIDQNNYWLASFQNSGNGFRIYRVTGGVENIEAIGNFGGPSSNKLKVVCAGNTITATLDGTSTISCTTATQGNTSTKFGIRDRLNYYASPRSYILDFLLWPGSGSMPSNPLYP